MCAAYSFPDDIDLVFGEAHRDEAVATVALDDVVEDSVGFGIADPEVTFVRLTFNEICGGGFVDNDFRDAQGAGNLPHLGLEKVSEGIDRRSIICVPSVVAEEALGFIAGSDGDSTDFGRLVEEDDHSRAGAHVSEALGGDSVFVLGDIAVDHSGYLDCSHLDS